MSGRSQLPVAARWALLLAVVAAGLWPYLAELGRVPMTADGRLWLERGDPASDGWREWVFGTRHFQVGYRPVAALTYTATLALRGVDLVALRATDLALHAATAIVLAVLLVRLVGGGAAWCGVAAALIFLAHPAGEEVVPYLARRSYPLALLLVLGAALCLVRARPASGGRAWRASAGAGLLVFAGLLTNEVAALPLAALPFLVLAQGRPGEARARARLLGGPALGAAAALGLRQLVIGALGGYEADADGVAAPGVALARGLTALLGFEPRGLGLVGALAVLALHVGAGRLGAGRERVQSLAWATWLLAGVALFAGLGVWFDRLAYTLAPAWAGLVALHLARAVGHAAGWRRAALLGALSISAALPLVRSPLFRGPDPDRALKWGRRQAVTAAAVAAVDALEGGARLQLVLPYSRFAESEAAEEDGDEDAGPEAEPAAGGGARRDRKRLPRDARTTFRWLQFVRPESEVRFAEFVYVEEPDWEWAEPTTLGEADGEPAIFAPAGRTLWTSGPPRPPTSGEAHVQRLVVRGPDRRASWYVFLYRPDGGELLPVPLD